jgi:anti-sigma-K factor RskA
MTHERLREHTGVYVLGLLGEDETRVFEAHLVSCAVCAREVRELSDVAVTLAELIEPQRPSPAVRARLLAAIAAEVSPEPTTAAPGGVRPPAIRGWMLLAASLAFVVAAGYAAVLRARIAGLEAALVTARERAAVVESQTAGLRHVADESARVSDILAAADLARIDLAGQAVAPNAAGRAYWSRSRGLVFTAEHLPPAPSGRVYQLWVVTAQAKISAGLLSIDANGRASVLTAAPGNIQAVAIAVTLEPSGGVRSPTGAMFLVGTL